MIFTPQRAAFEAPATTESTRAGKASTEVVVDASETDFFSSDFSSSSSLSGLLLRGDLSFAPDALGLLVLLLLREAVELLPDVLDDLDELEDLLLVPDFLLLLLTFVVAASPGELSSRNKATM